MLRRLRDEDRVHHRLKLIGAWLGILALAVQALLPVLHGPAMARGQMAMASAAADGLGGKTIVICTPSGYKIVTLDEGTGQNPPATPEKGKALFCPLCQAIQAAAALVPPSAPVLDRVVEPTRVAYSVFAQEPVSRPRACSSQPRAPPQTV